uniref:Uncharacterized protein n=1 Tax=Candidatus Kentrum sp. FM TaxID=2126340 RepID=A0A450TNM2_9GAMM|nr:MAG: hypothetical protein BECKFM1743C_GA0114222_105221 [Candidatus Kentron sp. FM]VFJ70041.1 MAG: hypothetical protein BECKFM1743A_GA0114220_105321 [Candidatus Kentron sp. FM]VFK18072.1 MAG: hypothetical protein BECKFM1743B_GA0114221_105222 [Candidatus Kentron sp. FM]
MRVFGGNAPRPYFSNFTLTARRAVLLSSHFLFFMYAFHAAISIRYWFAIDIAIRYRYRSYRAFPIASSDIDSDSERTTTPVAARRAYYYPSISCFLCTFPQALIPRR